MAWTSGSDRNGRKERLEDRERENGEPAHVGAGVRRPLFSLADPHRYQQSVSVGLVGPLLLFFPQQDAEADAPSRRWANPNLRAPSLRPRRR